MGRGNKATKERKAKAREEREAKAREEQKLVQPSNNGAAEVSATNSTSCVSSSTVIPTTVEPRSNTLESARASEDQKPQETVPVNGTANASCPINETKKECGGENEANAEAMKVEETPSGRAGLVKGGDARNLGEESSVVKLQPSKFEARQKRMVGGSNPGENRVYSAGHSAQSQSGGWGYFTTTGNGRGGSRGGYGHQAGHSAQPHSDRSGDFRATGNGRGGYGHPASQSRGDDSQRINSLGRLLSSILRHRAVELGLKVRSDGYVLVKDLLNLRLRSVGLPLSSHTVDDIKQAVRRDNKQRFGLREENGQLLIRANQGHSIETIKSEDLLSTVCHVEEAPVCVHGTYLQYLNAIEKEGLKRMGRLHIHFATGLPKEKGVISGMRSSCDVLIYLDVQKYLKDGMKLYRSENGVILAEGMNGVIPSAYFAKIERVQR